MLFDFICMRTEGPGPVLHQQFILEIVDNKRNPISHGIFFTVAHPHPKVRKSDNLLINDIPVCMVFEPIHCSYHQYFKKTLLTPHEPLK